MSELLVDPSSLLDAKALSQLTAARGEHPLLIPKSFVAALEEPEAVAALWAFFAGAHAPRVEEVRSALSFEAYRFWAWPADEEGTPDGDAQQRIGGIAELGVHSRVVDVLSEEWAYLFGHSWIGARSRTAFSHFTKAGAVAVDFGRRRLDDVVRRTLRDERFQPPRVLTGRDRMRAAFKWVAVGGPSTLGLLDPLTGAFAGTVGGFFLLFDP